MLMIQLGWTDFVTAQRYIQQYLDNDDVREYLPNNAYLVGGNGFKVKVEQDVE
jgi:hypothetical protein